MLKKLLTLVIQIALLAAISTPSHAQSVAVMQNAAVANGNGTLLGVGGTATAVLTVNCSGCGGGTTVNFEGTSDGTNYAALLGTLSGASTTATSTTTSGVGVWVVPSAGFQNMRARVSGYSSGTVTVTGRSVLAPSSSAGGGSVTISGTVNVDPVANTIGLATGAKQDTGNTSAASTKTNTDTLVTSGGGGYVRQDSTATIAKESGGNLATAATGIGATTVDKCTTTDTTACSLVGLIKNTNYLLVTPTGQQTMANSNSVTLASNQSAVDVELESASVKAGALNAAIPDPCTTGTKLYHIVNMSTATTVEIANAVASEFWHICGVNLVAAAAQTIAIGIDDTDGCGSMTAGLHGGATAATGWSFAANGGIALGNGLGTLMKSATANQYLCVITGQAQQISGTISYISSTQ